MRNIPLTPVHVVSTPAVSSPAPSWPAVPIPAELRQWQEDEAAKVMADAIKLVEDSATEGARREIKTELFFSAPVPTLVDLSKETQMVGCRGRGALRLTQYLRLACAGFKVPLTGAPGMATPPSARP